MRAISSRNVATWTATVLVLSMVLAISIAVCRPANVDALWMRGWNALNDGHLEEAHKAHLDLEKAAPDAPQTVILRAGLALKRGNASAALRLLNPARSPAALHKDDLRKPVLMLVSEALYSLGDLEEARAAALSGAKDFPNEPQFCRILAGVYYDLGAMQQALHQTEQLIRIAPKDYRPHYLAGVMWDDLDHPEKAIEHLTVALAKHPSPETNQEILEILLTNLIKTRRYKEVLDIISGRDLGERKSYWRAQYLAGLGRTEEALEVIRMARDKGVADADFCGLWGRLLDDSGKHTEAIPLFKQAVQLKPHDAQLQYLLAQAYRSVGQDAEADGEFEHFRRTQELRDKLTTLSQQADREIDNVQIREQLAEICVELGLEKLAETWRTAAQQCRKRRGQRELLP